MNTSPPECIICYQTMSTGRGHPDLRCPEKTIHAICRTCFAKSYATAQIDARQLSCSLCRLELTETSSISKPIPKFMHQWLRSFRLFITIINILKEEQQSVNFPHQATYNQIHQLMNETISRACNSNWSLLEIQEEYDAFSSIVYSHLSAQLKNLRNSIIGYYPCQEKQINLFLDTHPLRYLLASSTTPLQNPSA